MQTVIMIHVVPVIDVQAAIYPPVSLERYSNFIVGGKPKARTRSCT